MDYAMVRDDSFFRVAVEGRNGVEGKAEKKKIQIKRMPTLV